LVKAHAVPALQVEGPWARLHRAESDILASLLSVAEVAAIHRRLGLPAANAPAAWVPPSAGGVGARFAEPHGPGALYLALDLETCQAEIIHHHGRWCAESVGMPPGTRAVFRHLVFEVSGAMADATRERGGGLHDRSDYGSSWGYGRLVRAAGLDGVHYRSVRKRGGRCLAVFENRAVRFARVEFGAVVLEWDGTASRRIA
jgi:hypothetical protein